MSRRQPFQQVNWNSSLWTTPWCVAKAQLRAVLQCCVWCHGIAFTQFRVPEVKTRLFTVAEKVVLRNERVKRHPKAIAVMSTQAKNPG